MGFFFVVLYNVIIMQYPQYIGPKQNNSILYNMLLCIMQYFAM
jgi:hypothetical protein